MKLLDKPFDKAQKDDALRMIDGCICRICVSDDPEEIFHRFSLGYPVLSECFLVFLLLLFGKQEKV